MLVTTENKEITEILEKIIMETTMVTKVAKKQKGKAEESLKLM